MLIEAELFQFVTCLIKGGIRRLGFGLRLKDKNEYYLLTQSPYYYSLSHFCQHLRTSPQQRLLLRSDGSSSSLASCSTWRLCWGLKQHSSAALLLERPWMMTFFALTWPSSRMSSSEDRASWLVPVAGDAWARRRRNAASSTTRRVPCSTRPWNVAFPGKISPNSTMIWYDEEHLPKSYEFNHVRWLDSHGQQSYRMNHRYVPSTFEVSKFQKFAQSAVSSVNSFKGRLFETFIAQNLLIPKLS